LIPSVGGSAYAVTGGKFEAGTITGSQVESGSLGATQINQTTLTASARRTFTPFST
jgi:hypothetical protein